MECDGDGRGVDEEGDIVGESGRESGGDAPRGIIDYAAERLWVSVFVSVGCDKGYRGIRGQEVGGKPTPKPVTSTRVSVDVTGAMAVVLSAILKSQRQDMCCETVVAAELIPAGPDLSGDVEYSSTYVVMLPHDTLSADRKS